MVDYSTVRNNNSATTETVSVNHRALITRTLTKYPVDYALYRELLQNSADAGAESVVINYQTDTATGNHTIDNIHTVQSWPVKKLTVKNNGALFEDQDWNRLKEIAKGNPNESKIGAFGVGFYSVFELTDEPLVHSGSQLMSFFYQGDQLHYKKQDGESSNGWTIIDLPYRSQGTIPNLPQFTAFLTQSFMLVPLRTVTVKVDDIVLFELSRAASASNTLPIPRHVYRKSPNGTLFLDSMAIEAQQVTISYMNATQNNPTKSALLNFSKKFFSSLVTSSSDPAGNTSAVCFLRKVTATVTVSVSRSFANEMKATVMKSPPAKAVLSMLTFNHTEKELSKLTPPLINYMFPQDHSDAKIFIGFPTKQSPGMKSHLALNQVIPTMERTAVDMSNSFVKDWNQSMLYMAGIVSRVVYENEMTDLSKISFGTDEKAKKDIAVAASFIMSRFLSEPSAPDPLVGELIATGFWKCSKELSVLSQHGITTVDKIKLPGNASFIKTTPIVSNQMSADAMKFLRNATSVGYLHEISISDVIKELESRSLDAQDFRDFIAWGATLQKSSFAQCLQAAVVGNVSLAQIKHVQNIFTIESGMPLPPSCLPYELSKTLTASDLERVGWTDLQVIPDWLEYIIKTPPDDAHNITLSPEFAMTVLRKVEDSKLFPEQKKVAFNLLANVDCIPTVEHGMKPPSATYLSKIDLFPNLPVVSSQVSVSHTFLLVLGVRKSVSMEYVMNLLQDPENDLKWSSQDVIKYIQANRNSLKKADWTALKGTAFFKSSNASGEFRAIDLFGPHSDLKGLGFPVLDWKNWMEDSTEAELLAKIGLKKYPSVVDLFSRVGGDKQKAAKAVDYYLYGYKRGWYQSQICGSISDHAVIPVIRSDGHRTLAAPAKCWIKNEVKLFGLPAVDESLKSEASKFGIKDSPDIGFLIDQLIKRPPSSLDIADKMFSFMSTLLAQIKSSDAKRILMSPVIPLPNGRLVEPKTTFLETDSFQTEADAARDLRFMRDLFGFIRVSTSAQLFLQRIGMRANPTLSERAAVLVDNPQKVYDAARATSSNAYLEILTRIARVRRELALDGDLMRRMKQSKFLLGEKYSTEEDVKERLLCSPGTDNLVIADDVILYNLFKDQIITCPQIDDLEEFYLYLQCYRLSQVVRESYIRQGQYVDEQKQNDLKKRIIERVNLFLEGTPKENRRKGVDIKLIRIVLVHGIKKTLRLELPNLRSNSLVVAQDVCAQFDRETSTLWITLQNFDWFDISQSLIKSLLIRPSPDAAIVLEIQLSSEIASLERKGYNVQRLIQKQEEERRIALEERNRRENERKMASEEHMKREKQRLEELAQSKYTQMTPVKDEYAENETDKSTVDSRDPLISKEQAKHNAPSQQQLLQAVQPQSEKPSQNQLLPSHQSVPPHETGSQLSAPEPPAIENKLLKGFRSMFSKGPIGVASGIKKQQYISKPGSNSGEAMDNSSLSNVLQSGVMASKPFGQNSINTSINNDQVEDAVAQNSLKCEPVEERNLELSGRVQNGGTKCFVITGQPRLNENQMTEAQRFAEILAKCASVFQCSFDNFNIYFDTTGKVCAFNTNGSLFFNLRFFLSPMHHNPRPLNGEGVVNKMWDKEDALDYWFPVIAHELAHNIVQPHGSDHSFMTESYVQFYMQRFQAVRATSV